MAKAKKKSGKKGSVFKVVGPKSMKSKTKAKAVKTQLKKIDVKKNVEELDKQLKTVQTKVRQSPKKKQDKKVVPVGARGTTRLQVEADKRSTRSRETIAKLKSMKV